MEDLKKLIFPAIVAIILHGFLFSCKFPKHHLLKPVLKAAPIEIQINSVSPSKNIPKKIEPKKEKTVPKPKVKNNDVLKQIKKQPVAVPEQPKKNEIVPNLIKKEPIVEKVDLQKQPLENQINNKNETPPLKVEEIVAEPIREETTETIQTEASKNDPADDLSEELISTPPIQKKAVPMYRQNSQPLYPVMAKRRGWEGELLLSVLVATAGDVSELKVKHSSGHLSLDRAALKAVKGWIFSPAMEGDRPVAMWVDVPIMFQLK